MPSASPRLVVSPAILPSQNPARLIALRDRGTVPPATEQGEGAVQETSELARAPKQRSPRLPILALAAWAFFTLLVPRLVEQLNIVDVFAFPLGFFMSAQGSLLVLLVVAILSARHQDKLATRGDE